jgi:hypothetical protein
VEGLSSAIGRFSLLAGKMSESREKAYKDGASQVLYAVETTTSGRCQGRIGQGYWKIVRKHRRRPLMHGEGDSR